MTNKPTFYVRGCVKIKFKLLKRTSTPNSKQGRKVHPIISSMRRLPKINLHNLPEKAVHLIIRDEYGNSDDDSEDVDDDDKMSTMTMMICIQIFLKTICCD
ncbi:uncharacterized protein LOC105220333 isoform X2 [Zeugodacus cucurbitae]|uniref:uncharacterized protein LOC105220333 isoform X2 n=1 Tax=Zeugodacus cucurbitae TaxID=28588 RepID=UPI0005968773|nr:uncharacterized protein LOC105220333 isoform X2 [Zeugodacus cucurbitae]